MLYNKKTKMSGIPPHILEILNRRNGKTTHDIAPAPAGAVDRRPLGTTAVAHSKPAPSSSGKKAEKPVASYKDIIRDAPGRKVVHEYFARKVAKMNEPPDSEDDEPKGPKKTRKAK
jgi:hypothetical protein